MSTSFDDLYELTRPRDSQIILTRIMTYVDRALEKDPGATEHVIEYLQYIGPDTAGLEQHESEQLDRITSALMQVLREPESVDILLKRAAHPEQRALALTLLGWFGPRAAAAVPELVVRFGGSSHGISAIARRAIVRIGGGELEILNAIHKSIIDQDDGDFRELTHLALMANLGASSKFVEMLPLVIHSNNSDLKEAAASFIGELAPEIKKELVYVLEALKNDPDAYVRLEAQDTLGQIPGHEEIE